MQESDFITQFILEIKLTHYMSSLSACPGTSDQTNLIFVEVTATGLKPTTT